MSGGGLRVFVCRAIDSPSANGATGILDMSTAKDIRNALKARCEDRDRAAGGFDTICDACEAILGFSDTFFCSRWCVVWFEQAECT